MGFPPLALGDFNVSLEVWIAAGIGMAITAAALATGYSLLRERRRRVLAVPPVKSWPACGPVRDPFVYGSAAERRAALRRNGNPTAVLLTDAEAKTEPTPGWVLDRSTGGLGLAVGEQVEPGTLLSIRTVNAPRIVPWIQLEVKTCRAEDGCWELGCQFRKTPPWSVLLLFG
jgi:hypothetical protein